MTDNPNPDDASNDDSMTVSRRAIIGALGAAGVLGATANGQRASSGSMTAGGGNMADELSGYEFEWYELDEAELPSAGAAGRFVRITSGGSNYSAGDILRDDGSSWSKIDAGFGSVNTEKADITHGKAGQVGLGPLQSASISTITTVNGHVMGHGFFPVDENDWVILYTNPQSHSPDNDAVLKAVDSPDQAETIENERTILDDDSDPRNFACVIMNNGRLGVVLPRRNDSGGPKDMGFLYSDDDGSSWTLDTFSGPAAPRLVQAPIINYPASVGGDDADGFVVGGQSSASGVNEPYLYRTTDNGSSWDSVKIDATGTYLEPSIQRVGTQDKWVIVTRNDDSTADNPGAIYTTEDLSNFSGPTEMNVAMGRNPSNLVYADGYFHLFVNNRRTDGTGLTDYPEGILVQRVDAESVYNNPGSAWNDEWEVVARGAERNTGYLNIKEVAGRYYSTMHNAEDRTATKSELSLVSPVGGASRVPTSADFIWTGEHEFATPSSDNNPLRWQEGVEAGTVTADGVDNSGGNDDWGQAASTTVSVSFSSAFNNTPNVVVTINQDQDNVNSREYMPQVINISTTGFDVVFYQMSATDNSSTTDAYAADYLATEGR